MPHCKISDGPEDDLAVEASVLYRPNRTSRANSPRQASLYCVPRWIFDWRTLFAVSVSFSVVALALWRLLLNEADKQTQFEQEVKGVMQWYETALIGQIESSLSSLHALSALLRVDSRNVTVDNFPSIAEMLIEQLHGITNLQLAHYGTVSQIHPLEGNEGAIGHALLLDPFRASGALATIEERSVVMVGPLLLLQGGSAIIARLAIFSLFTSEFLPDETWTSSDGETFSRTCSDPSALDENCQFKRLQEDGNVTYFWGFATMVTLVEDLLATLDFERLEDGFHLNTRFRWQLSDRTPHSSLDSTGLFAYSSVDALQQPLCTHIDIVETGVDWQLCVSPHGGWPTVSSEFWVQLGLFVAATGLMAAAAGFMVIGSVRSGHHRMQRLEDFRWQRKRAVVENCVADVDRVRYPMCVMDLEAFKTLGTLIRHEKARDEGKLLFLDTIEQIKATAPHIVFVSHQWTGFGNPDHSGIQYQIMVQACDLLVRKGFDIRWVWVDIFSIPQDNEDLQQGCIDTLAVYAANCSVFVSAVPHCKHAQLNTTLDVETYFSRGWCRLEQLAYLSASLHKSELHAFWCAGEVLEPLFHETSGEWHTIKALEVLRGEFTCCTRNHPHRSACDKESIVGVLLGILWRFKQSQRVRTSRTMRYIEIIDAEVDHFFPPSYVYHSEGTTEIRELFGDLVDVLQGLFEHEMAVRDEGGVVLHEGLSINGDDCHSSVYEEVEM